MMTSTKSVRTDDVATQILAHEQVGKFAEVLMTALEDTEDWVFDPKDMSSEVPAACRFLRIPILLHNLKIRITQRAYLLLALYMVVPLDAAFILRTAGNYFESIRADDWLVDSTVVMMGLFPDGYAVRDAVNQWWHANRDVAQDFPDDWKND